MIVHINHGHRHDLSGLDLSLVQGAIDHSGLDLGVEDGHQGGRLHNVGTVVARQGHVDLEFHLFIQGFDLIEHLGIHFGRVSACPQQCQDKRGELMPQRNGGEPHAVCLALFGDHKGGCSGVRSRIVKAHLV